MQLRGIEFGHAFCSSGARNFTGRGWPHHKLLEPFSLEPRYCGSGFIGKTMTLYPREGNMALQEDGLTPRDKRPDCVMVNLWKGIALNAVGLSNIGADFYLRHLHLREFTDPFLLSFMSVGDTPERRLNELRGFLTLLIMQRDGQIPSFRMPFAVQENFSCPNTGHGQEELLRDVRSHLDAWEPMGIPVILKFNVLATPEVVAEIAKHPACDAISVSNTIPWGQLPDRINWKKLFGSDVSPLAKYGGGGLSGKPLLPLVEEWIAKARPLIQKPIMGGGGVLCAKDADRLINVGAGAIEIGSASMLRPWRVQGMINHINKRFAERNRKQ